MVVRHFLSLSTAVTVSEQIIATDHSRGIPLAGSLTGYWES
jgi:hypothetical protein